MTSNKAGKNERTNMQSVEAANAEIDRLKRRLERSERRHSKVSFWQIFSVSSISLAALTFPPVVMLGVAAIDGINNWSGNPPLDTALSSTIANNASQVWLVTAGSALQRMTGNGGNNGDSDGNASQKQSGASKKPKETEEDLEDDD